MPYGVKKKGGKWVVYNRETGKVYGTHPSKVAAVAQLKAIYANTGGK